jgi:hypothetical protein
MKIKLLFFFSFLLLIACSRDEHGYDPDNPILGTWVFSNYSSTDNIYTFKRSNGFIEDHCYKFNGDGTLVERKNSGWCGTPPVTYSDYNGNWTVNNDSRYLVNVGYWGGTTSYIINVIEADSKELKFTIEYTNG